MARARGERILKGERRHQRKIYIVNEMKKIKVLLRNLHGMGFCTLFSRRSVGFCGGRETLETMQRTTNKLNTLAEERRKYRTGVSCN